MNRIRTVLCCVGFAGMTLASAAAQDQPAPVENPPAQPPTEPPAEQPDQQPPENPPPTAAVDPALRGLIEQAAQRLREARTLSFHGNTTHGGTLIGKSPAASAVVRMVRVETPTPMWLFRSTGSGGRNPDDAPTPFDVAWDRQRVVWLDTEAKRLVERPFSGVKGQLVQMAMAAVPTQFHETIPFTRELAAESMTLEGTETLGGVTCDIVAVRYRARLGVTRFWLGESDRLPRRIKRTSESTAYPNSTIYEITDLKIDEPITEEQVTISLPEGFERDTTVPATPRPLPAPQATAPPIGPADPPPAAAVPKDEFPPVPAFALPGPDGVMVTPESLKGSVAVLYFWGTWSLPSRLNADPAVQALHDTFKDRPVKVFGMSVREKTKDASAEFLRSLGRTYTNLADADSVARAFSVVQFPTFVIVDREGRVRKTIAGFQADTTADELRKAVEELLSPAPTPTETGT